MAAERKLLRRYAARRDAEAMAAILRRHQDSVYGTCLRVLADAPAAEEATQECFFQLARRAGAVRGPLADWLHGCATRVARRALDTARRCQGRAAGGAGLRACGGDVAATAAGGQPADWSAVAPLLDEAIEELWDDLRVALVERFLLRRAEAGVAEESGVPAEAMHERVGLAVHALGRRLGHAGVELPPEDLAKLLDAYAWVAAPASLRYGLGKLALAGVGRRATGAGLRATGSGLLATGSGLPAAGSGLRLATAGVGRRASGRKPLGRLASGAILAAKDAAVVAATVALGVGLLAGLNRLRAPSRPVAGPAAAEAPPARPSVRQAGPVAGGRSLAPASAQAAPPGEAAHSGTQQAGGRAAIGGAKRPVPAAAPVRVVPGKLRMLTTRAVAIEARQVQAAPVVRPAKAQVRAARWTLVPASASLREGPDSGNARGAASGSAPAETDGNGPAARSAAPG